VYVAFIKDCKIKIVFGNIVEILRNTNKILLKYDGNKIDGYGQIG